MEEVRIDMTGPVELTIDMMVAEARNQLELTEENAEQLRIVFGTHVASLNRLRAINVDASVEPDLVFSAEGGHD